MGEVLQVTCIAHDGARRTFKAGAGDTLMSAAVENEVDGIVAECGGSCSCATCHVYVDPAWRDRIEPPSEIERELLNGKDDVQDTSRLSCQIVLTETLDGLTVRLPESQ
ncbi:MAG: 2Fe-2S iron-sulfur cluster-binding protein [Pseudomonadota bacterium]